MAGNIDRLVTCRGLDSCNELLCVSKGRGPHTGEYACVSIELSKDGLRVEQLGSLKYNDHLPVCVFERLRHYSVEVNCGDLISL